MPRKLPPLNALRAFECSARLGSFARAANELAQQRDALLTDVEAQIGQAKATVEEE